MSKCDPAPASGTAESYDLLDTLSHLLRRSHFHAEKPFNHLIHSATSATSSPAARKRPKLP